MANIMTKRGNLDNIVTYEHICDTAADMQNIDPRTATLGSVCIVIKGENDNLEVYIADSNKEWHLLSTNSGGSGSDVGVGIHICGNDEYDSTTGQPSVEDPIENQFYLVPSSGTDSSNLFDEWIYINEKWEKFGSSGTAVTNANWTATSNENGYINNKPSIEAGSGNHSIEENYHSHTTHTNTYVQPYVDGATGNDSHAEGYNTAAIGNQSHAEGYTTIAQGVSSHAEGSESCAKGNYSHAEGTNTTTIGDYSHAEGTATIALANASHAEGSQTQAIGQFSHAEGDNTTAQGTASHTEGSQTQAIGLRSHAEGSNTTAVENYSHAEGLQTVARGVSSHVEGDHALASGAASHAEGLYTTASGYASHAEGEQTIANSSNQHVSGRYNIPDSVNTYAEIIGNGSSNARSNARTLDWNGNEWLAGNLTLNQTTLTENKLQYLVGLNINNTLDADKPVSTAQRAAIDAVTTKTVEVTGTDVIIEAVSNTRYICGELSTLDFTPSSTGISDVLFTSGSSKTILTLPNTVKMPDWFEDTEANTVYEISIADGVYGVVTSWAI